MINLFPLKILNIPNIEQQAKACKEQAITCYFTGNKDDEKKSTNKETGYLRLHVVHPL